MKTIQQKKAVVRRKYHVRKKVTGTAERPRLSVFRSNRHIYAQIIDDAAGVTLAACGTKSQSVRADIAIGSNQKAAKAVGEAIAKQALDAGIRCVSFDRNRYKYHGRIKTLADAAREAGLKF
jgi:large subunit ribosomal protein L18